MGSRKTPFSRVFTKRTPKEELLTHNGTRFLSTQYALNCVLLRKVTLQNPGRAAARLCKTSRAWSSRGLST